ncbi:MAG TPA: pilus assembly protein TadG-related protein [Myxococcota bacterium]|nr:pilus assembly protein TadG-related protein [Myxococcota bacterium]
MAIRVAETLFDQETKMSPLKMKVVVKGQRGQIMMLGAMGVILVALMMLLTLNVGKAVYEKIRIQQLADSAAFSSATVAARSFNFYAYTNRANIAGLVAAASAHGFMSLATTVPKMFTAGERNFYVMAAEEVCLCCCGCPYFLPCRPKHCKHAIKDGQVARKYRKEAKNLLNKLKKSNKSFIAAIKMLDTHMALIAGQQQAMRAWVELDALGTDKVTRDLIKRYAPNASNVGLVAGVSAAGVLSAKEYENAMEGNADIRRWVATEIANGTRNTKFVFNRGMWNILLYIAPKTLKKLVHDIPNKAPGGKSIIVGHKGESRIVEGGTGVDSKIASGNHGPKGDAAAGADKGWIFSSLANHCIPVMTLPYAARVGTDKNSGEHKCKGFSWGTCCGGEGKHKDAFKCLGDDGKVKHNCFMLFHADDNAKNDFGQPSVYATIDQDLRRTKGGGDKQAWEIAEDGSGEVAMDLGGSIGKHEVQMSDNPSASPEGSELGKGLAISKALVYYHLPEWDDNEGWKEHPNFFNPYWKAKLQPFRNALEVGKVLLGTPYSAKYAAMLVGGVIAKVPLP